MTDQGPAKRQRVSKACEQCRRKKVKCDGQLPHCSNCVVLRVTCAYNDSVRKRGPPKGYIEAIERRLFRLETLLGSVIQEDDPRAQAILEEINTPLKTPYGELIRPRLMTGDREPLRLIDSEEDQQPADQAADNLGNQYIDETGQMRYYGKASGYYMLRGSKTFQEGTFHFNSRGYQHNRGSNDLQETAVVDPFEMPPPDLAESLLDLYFSHFYCWLPMLHKKSFMDAYRSRDNPPPPLLLNAIFAVASRISPDDRVRTRPDLPETAGDIFVERAKRLLEYEWENFRVSTVQSLLLLSSHQNGAMKTIRGWLYSGLAFRMLQNLGLNRNCDSWNLSDSEKENRKRCFFACFLVDRLSCAMYGRTPVIDERDYDTPFPTMFEEDRPAIIENFHQLIKLSSILGSILRQLYTVQGRKQLSMMSTPDRIVSALDKELNAWMTKLPPHQQYKPPNTRLGESGPVPPLERCQLHMLYYTLLILLHRPFIPGPTQTTRLSVFPSAAICTYAANKILDISVALMEAKRLKSVNNYALYFMFTAGIIFINDASSRDSLFAFEAKISVNKIMRCMEEVESTWLTSARHTNILGELAGLRDINLEECANTDEYPGQIKERQQHSPIPTPAIAVPNSPDTSPVYMPEHVAYNTQIPLPSSSPSSPSTASFESGRVPYAVPASDPFPSSNNTNPVYDPLATAFWDVPTSFDFEQWNDYFSNQNQLQQ